MKQKLFIFLFLILIVVTLVGLNAASYVQKEKTPDSELSPNRSTFNVGATGTNALYSLLSETGRKVIRWQEPPSALLAAKKNVPSVFVVIGSLRREFAEDEIEPLLKWVSNGGRLVLIDREPPSELVTTTANWRIKFDSESPFKFLSVDPSDQNQMTADMQAIKPVQPTTFTNSINAIQPSRLASSIKFERFENDETKSTGQGSGIGSGTIMPPPPPKSMQTADEYYDDSESEFSAEPEPSMESSSNDPTTKKNKLYTVPSPTPVKIEQFVLNTDNTNSPSQSAPVVHFASESRNLLVEVPFGEGKIVFLADPFIVSNGGIGLVDNAQLTINILAAGNSPIAFDEYHQGYGANNNKFLEFFEGTPVVAIFLQCLLLAGFVFFSQSRRFARAVPEVEPDRFSKLEYVSAMAELQERTHSFDLAIENIYKEFRRRAARLLGADNYTVRYDDLAKLIAERTGLDPTSVAGTLFKSEEIIRGEPTNKREVLELSGELRHLEERLGLTRNRKSRI
ncbi:MAG: DUF4350 domain-containing protein [Chloracidobacterium sp.]|nr:DUF4350 domain-containing protein [Chloracidobacterium sp.]